MNRCVRKAERHQAVMGVITGLLKALARLTPHPSRPNDTGPLLIQNSPYYAVPGEQDSMLGQIFMEALLGPVFSEAVSETPGNLSINTDLNNIAESASEYLKDRHDPHTGEGKGSFALCKHRAIANGFNSKAVPSFLHASLMDRFRSDLPRRQQIEKALSFFSAQLLEPAIS